LSAGAIAGAFDITRPAISRHLRVLREAGLVVDEPQGRERVYRLELDALDELERFLAELREATSHERADGHDAAAWERRFMALDTVVARTKRDRVKKQATSRVAIDASDEKETA
jgi:predicted ArsR family transcriptional regulator